MSLCVRDILKGIVSLDQVILLDAGTMIDTCDKLTELVEYYKGIYWKSYPLSQCMQVVETLLFTHRLRQERVMPNHDGNHLERSLTLHEKRFGVNHSEHDVEYTFESENDHKWRHVNGPPDKLGNHWEIVGTVDPDEDEDMVAMIDVMNEHARA